MPEAIIAVVIPAYNAGPYLPEAIESVLNQTLAQWECVIVDDGSTDETPLVVKSYADPRIQSVRQENRGERGARLQGFSLTRACKIVFLDADDRLLPHTLARYTSFLDDHPSVDVAYGERMLIDQAGNTIGWGGPAYLNKHPQGDVLEPILRRPFLSTPSQACLRRETVPPANWIGGRGILGDWVLLAAVACNGRFAYMGKPPLVQYRIRIGSQMRTFAVNSETAAGRDDYDDVLDRLFSFPGLEERFDAERLSDLKRAARATCLAIRGQEFLRTRDYAAAYRHFSLALQAGSRDIRDLLCWLGTLSPPLVRWAEPLYGAAHTNRATLKSFRT